MATPAALAARQAPTPPMGQPATKKFPLLQSRRSTADDPPAVASPYVRKARDNTMHSQEGRHSRRPQTGVSPWADASTRNVGHELKSRRSFTKHCAQCPTTNYTGENSTENGVSHAAVHWPNTAEKLTTGLTSG